MFNSVNVVTDDLFSSAQCLHNIDIYKISFLTVSKLWIYGMNPDSFHSVFLYLVSYLDAGWHCSVIVDSSRCMRMLRHRPRRGGVL